MFNKNNSNAPLSYGYSVWYVPDNYRELQERYNIQHIPHVTLKTKMSFDDASNLYHSQIKIADTINIEYYNKFITFPAYDKNDHLQYRGWKVNIVGMNDKFKSVNSNWNPHMTVEYTVINNNKKSQSCHMEVDPPHGKSPCFLVIADTNDVLPCNWRFCHSSEKILNTANAELSLLTNKLKLLKSKVCDELNLMDCD